MVTASGSAICKCAKEEPKVHKRLPLFLWVTHADSFRKFFSQGTLFSKEFEVIFLLVNFYFDTERSSVKSVSHSELYALFLLTEFVVLPTKVKKDFKENIEDDINSRSPFFFFVTI